MFASIEIDEDRKINVKEYINMEKPPSVKIMLNGVKDDSIKIKCVSWEVALKLVEDLLVAVMLAYENSSLKDIEKDDKEMAIRIEEKSRVKAMLRLVKPDKKDS